MVWILWDLLSGDFLHSCDIAIDNITCLIDLPNQNDDVRQLCHAMSQAMFVYRRVFGCDLKTELVAL